MHCCNNDHTTTRVADENKIKTPKLIQCQLQIKSRHQRIVRSNYFGATKARVLLKYLMKGENCTAL